MKKKMFRKVICLILSVTTLFGLVGVTAMASSDEVYYGSNRDTASSLKEMQSLVGVSSYDDYLIENGNVFNQNLSSISVDIFDVVSSSSGVKTSQSEQCLDSFEENQALWSDFNEGEKDNWENSMYLPSQGSTTWNYTVPKGAGGYYYIKIRYYSCVTAETSISAIERKLYIGGRAPFEEASRITLDKDWSYSNIVVSEPVATDEADGTSTVYELRDDDYCKVVTVIEGGMKTVTTYVMSQDINGNSMSPGMTQNPGWSTYYCQDSTGYYEGYFRFYLNEGPGQLTLAAEREPVIIGAIEFEPCYSDGDIIKSYAEVKAEYEANGYKPAGSGLSFKESATVIQTEFPDLVSDSSIYPMNDKTSSANYPSVPNAQLYNVIGKNSYDTLGQWVAYKFYVQDTGLYKISARYLQNSLEGMYVCRSLMLTGGIYDELADGAPAVPFKEAYDIQFNYSKDWQSKFLSDSNGTEFEFYFEEGEEYTLYLECSLGSLKELIQDAERSLAVLNESYLKILQVTGAAPDEYRDYRFMEIMPEVIKSLGEEAVNLERIHLELKALCGGKNGAHIATLETIYRLLHDMGDDLGYNVAANMSNLKTNLGTLGTWINDSKKGKIVLDSITVCPADTQKKSLPKSDANFFKAAWFEITSFIYSFFTDYNSMGITQETLDNSENAVSIDVWLAMGRDQSNIWRSMIDAQEGFTDTTGYAVNLKLVTAGTLLPSILSGKGPDVYMGLGSADVINYAIRDAVVPISEDEVFNTTKYTYEKEGGGKEITTEYRGEDGLLFTSYTFDDYVEANFVDAAMDTVTLLGKSYAIPQTMSFAMMFYRMDVLADLGQEVPETWDQLLSMLPVLQSNNMEIGITYTLALDFMLYQKGGNMWKYTDIPEYAGAQVALDSNIAAESFEYVCRLYTDYSFPVAFDSANRFRTAEMPILVGDYASLYNQLVVYATEIEGLWEFCPLPGCEREDGTINYDSLATVSGSVMLHGCEGEEKFAAWEFMQWETSAKVQAEYGNRMVSILGPSAKYETANINAIKNMSWTANEKAAIEDQIAHMSSIVNYPGSYIIARHIKFAFLDVVNGGADPYDALSDNIKPMNDEIKRKREEFKDLDLGILDTNQTPPGYHESQNQ